MKKVVFIMVLVVFLSKTFAQTSKSSDRFTRVLGENTKGNLILALGKNTLSNSQKEIYDNLDMAKSRFYEVGYVLNSAISKKSNLLHLNYGLSLVYNSIRLKNGYAFKQDITAVVAAKDATIKQATFRNVYLQIPVHLEFDFTSERKRIQKKIIKQGFKVGVGGFLGCRTSTKQFIDRKDGEEQTYSGFKMNNITYGISSYIGYNFVSLYIKYDVAAMFYHNVSKETPNPHHVSFGLRFDI